MPPLIFPFFFQYNNNNNPNNIPPKCAKCATELIVPDIPKKNSIAPYPHTIYFALIGTGMNIIYNGRLGKSIPNASKIPKIPPDAPTVSNALSAGMF